MSADEYLTPVILEFSRSDARQLAVEAAKVNLHLEQYVRRLVMNRHSFSNDEGGRLVLNPDLSMRIWKLAGALDLDFNDAGAVVGGLVTSAERAVEWGKGKGDFDAQEFGSENFDSEI